MTLHNSRPVTRADFAGWGAFVLPVAEIVQSVCLNTPDGAGLVAANPGLLPQSVQRIFSAKSVPLATATSAVARELDPETLALVLSKERRATVVEALLRHNSLPFAAQEKLATRPSEGLARALLAWDGLDESFRRPLAVKVGGRDLLREMAFSGSSVYGDDEILALVDLYDSVRPSVRRGELSFLIQTLFSRRPGLVPEVVTKKVVSERSRFLYALASSDLSDDGVWALAHVAALDPELDRHALQVNRHVVRRLISNPRTPLLLADALVERTAGTRAGFDAESARVTRGKAAAITADPASCSGEELQRFLQFTEPRPGWFSSPWVAFRLLCNPLLTGFQRTHLESRVARSFPGRLLDLVGSDLVDAGVVLDRSSVSRNAPRREDPRKELFDSASDALGANRQAWEVFLSLVDEFDGEFEELLGVSCQV